MALIANRYLEGIKARREYATKLYDAVREDVRLSVIAAAEYWSGPTDARKAQLESTMRMLHSEIVQGARLLDEYSSTDDASRLDMMVRDFTKALTGSSFEQAKVTPDKPHVIVVTAKGSRLRRELAIVRRRQLS